MGLLDLIVGAAVSKATSGSANSSALLGTVVQYVTSQPGGIAGFLSQLQQGGLGDVVASWVGTGQNLPVSGDQLSQALGSGVMQQLAQQSGLSTNGIADQIAQWLPHLIDHATPNGAVPAGQTGDLAQQLLSALPGLLARQA